MRKDSNLQNNHGCTGGESVIELCSGRKRYGNIGRSLRKNISKFGNQESAEG